MHPDDAKSRAAGIFCFAGGAALTWWSWHSALGEGHYSMKVAILGPTVLVLGLGLLIHGRGIPTSGATRLTRIYGFAGGVAAIVSLHLLGYFARPPRHRWTDLLYTALPFAMLLVWFLPSRVFGAPEAAAAPPVAPLTGPTNEPIEPK